MILAGGLSAVLVVWNMRRFILPLAGMVDADRGGVHYAVALIWLLHFWVPNRLRLDAAMIFDGLAPVTRVEIGWPTLGGALLVTGGWLVAFALIQRRMAVPLVALLVVFSWVGLVCAPGRTLSWDAVLGGVGALAAYAAWRERERMFPVAVVVAFCGLFVSSLFAEPDGREGISWTPLAEFGAMPALETFTTALAQYYVLLAMPLLFAQGAIGPAGRWQTGLLATALALLMIEALGYVTGHGASTTPFLFLALGTVVARFHLLDKKTIGSGAHRIPGSSRARMENP